MLRKGCPGCPGESVCPAGGVRLLFFLPRRAAGREQRSEPKPPRLCRSRALSRREEAAPRLSQLPAPGSGAGLRPPASLSARGEARLKLFGHFGMWYFKWLF